MKTTKILIAGIKGKTKANHKTSFISDTKWCFTYQNNMALLIPLLSLSGACKQLSWGSIHFGKCLHLIHKLEYSLCDTGKEITK